MIESTSSSICDAVFSPQINPAPPSKYWFCTVARHIMPNLSDIPYIVTMARAIFVAFSISFAAPLVTELNTSTSAARPAIYVVILARSSSFVSRYFSSSGVWSVYPSAPMVRGTIVIFCTGSVFFCRADTSACPTSWYETIFLSLSLMTRSFFSLPPTATSSKASKRSAWFTSCLPFLTALMAASLIILARSEPTSPAVASASASRSTDSSILTSFECTFKVSRRPFKSGLSTMILLSKRPGRRSALSSTSGRLVAANISNPFDVSKPSISARSWFSVCSRSSLPPPYLLSRLFPIASISSIKIIHGAIFCASLNKSRTLEAPTPTNISTKSEPASEKNGTPASPATALARSVLPVPGGPTRSAPLGSLAPISVYFFGL